MKIRTDFVTNSSSSSFILGFKDDNSVEECLRNNITGDYFSRIVEDCVNADRMTFEEMIEQYKEEIAWYNRWETRYNYRNYGKTYDEIFEWVNTKDFEEACEKELEKRIENIRKMCEDKEVFVRVVYGDDCGDSELEHHIIPGLDCCITRISHH